MVIFLQILYSKIMVGKVNHVTSLEKKSTELYGQRCVNITF